MVPSRFAPSFTHVRVAEVGPVAFSEGMRMAAAIYAARGVDRQGAAP
jgi:hypothetical protein